jgi:hypothetical protein
MGLLTRLLGALQDRLLERRLLFGVELRFAAWARSIVKPGETFGVIAQHRVTQRCADKLASLAASVRDGISSALAIAVIRHAA